MNFHFDLHVSKETTYPNSRYIESNTGGGIQDREISDTRG
jgi:hypothetical protein